MGRKFVENYEKMSDGEIVSRINSGNYELLRVIIDRYYSVIMLYVRRYCPHESREDAVQEATLALYSAVKSFDSSKASFSTFASLCIKRAVISVLKSDRRKARIPDELLSSIDEVELTDGNTPEKIFLEKESYKSLADTIRLELSDLEYRVLELYLAGKSYTDIAQGLKISEKSVDNSLSRIRKKLKGNNG